MDIRLKYLAAAMLAPLTAATLSGCQEAHSVAPPEAVARPVSYLSLAKTNPARAARVTGSVESWKKEWIGFEVAGRVKYVREPGVNVDARMVADNGDVQTPGTLVATIDSERLQVQLEEAKSRSEAARREAEALRIEIEQTIPSQLEEAQAEFDRANSEFDRQRKLAKSGATAQVRVDNARAAFTAAKARVAQVQAHKRERRSQLAALEASRKEADEAVQEARIDVEDANLYAPFNGQVSKVHVIPGGYVERGQPVATVQMMDPMQVKIAVSAAVDADVQFNDVMKVYVGDGQRPSQGWVWNKATVADATTRTFMVTLMVRNREIETGVPPELEGKPFHRTASLWPLESEFDNGAAPYFANEDTLHRDEQGYFVWKVEGLDVADLETDFNPVFRVTKVRVEPTMRRKPFMHVLTYRELTNIGELNAKNCLFAAKLPDGVNDGDTVVLLRKQWLLRPGQLVQVDLHHGRMQEAFYVPVQSVVKQGSGHHVFVVDEAAEGKQHATRVAVTPAATIGDAQAVKAVNSGQLMAGGKLIVDGVHYLRDGDPVNAFNELEARR